MIYSLSELETVGECESLIQATELEKEELEFRKKQQDRVYKNVTTGSIDVDIALTAVEAEIQAQETVLASNLPAGVARTQAESRLTRANFKKFVILERKGRYGTIALIQKELEIACIDKALEETALFLTAVEARKDEL